MDHNMHENSGIASDERKEFLGLPTEIHIKILSNLCFHCTREPRSPQAVRALYNCSLVCKSLRAVALPLMWHQPYFQGNRASPQLDPGFYSVLGYRGNNWMESVVSSTSRIPGKIRLGFLINFLLENPSLAKHVKEISYEVSPIEPDLSFMQMAEDLSMVKALEKYGPQHFLLPYGPIGSDFDIRIQIFLTMVDKIQTLSLRALWEHSLFGHLANRCRRLGIDYMFPELRSVLIRGDPSPCCTMSTTFSPQDRMLDCRFLLETAPKLQSLRLYSMGRHELPITNLAAVKMLQRPLPTCLTSIELLNSVFIREEDLQLFLKPLIEHCARLERFTMQLRVCKCLARPTIKRLVSPGDMVDMLETQRKSLEYLSLYYLDSYDLLHHSEDPLEPGATIPTIYMTTEAWYAAPTLRTFSALKELHIDEQSFCRHWKTQSYVETEADSLSCLTDIVPQCIQRLSVSVRPGSRAWGDISHFVKEITTGHYPHLEKMRFILVVSIVLPHNFHQPLDEEPRATFVRETRAVKETLESTKVEVAAAFLGIDSSFSAAPMFEALRGDLEEGLGSEELELPFGHHAAENWHEVCIHG